MVQPYRMFLALPGNEAEQVLDGLREFMSEGHFSFFIRTSLDLDAEPAIELLLDLNADSDEEAMREANRIWEKARGFADLPPSEADVLGFSLIETLPASLDERLWTEADSHFQNERFRETVTVVQTSCEVLARRTMEQLASDRGMSWVLRLCDKKPSLRDSISQTVFNGLAGDEIQKQDWWPSYTRHLDLRNKVAHDGASVNFKRAQESIQAGAAFRRFVRSKLRSSGS